MIWYYFAAFLRCFLISFYLICMACLEMPAFVIFTVILTFFFFEQTYTLLYQIGLIPSSSMTPLRIELPKVLYANMFWNFWPRMWIMPGLNIFSSFLLVWRLNIFYLLYTIDKAINKKILHLALFLTFCYLTVTQFLFFIILQVHHILILKSGDEVSRFSNKNVFLYLHWDVVCHFSVAYLLLLKDILLNYASCGYVL